MKKAKVGLCLWALFSLVVFIILLSIPTRLRSENDIIPVKEIAKTVPEVPQILLDISWCESRSDQNKIGYNYHNKTMVIADGSTTTQKVVWSKDIGLWQINDFFHEKAAKKLGLDIHTSEGNTQYAMILYKRNGTRDWNASKPCWSNIKVWKAKERSYY